MKKNLTILVIGVFVTALVLTGCGGGGPAEQLGLGVGSYGEAELANGVHLMVHPTTLAQSPLVAIAVRLPAGVDAEQPGEAGYSSLLARLIARTGEGTAATELAGMGSALTVEVQVDALLLTTTILQEDAEAAYVAIANALNGQFVAEDVSAERDRFVSELDDATDSVRARDLLNSTLFKGSPRAVELGDRLEALRSLTSERFADFTDRVFKSGGVKVAVVGAFDEALLEVVINESQALPSTNNAKEASSEEAAAEEEANGEYTPILVLDRPGDATGLFLLRRLPALDPQVFYRLEAINLILNGQSTYSRLTAAQVALRLPRPIDSALDLHAGESSHIVSSTVPSERAAEVFAATVQEMQRLHSGTVLNSRLTEQEIADARNFLTGRLMRRTETSVQLARFLIWSAAHGFPGHRPEDHMALIEALDKEALLETVGEYFDPRINALIAVGPAETLQVQFADFGEARVVQ